MARNCQVRKCPVVFSGAKSLLDSVLFLRYSPTTKLTRRGEGLRQLPFLFTVFVMAIVANAQTFGEITGRISDASGAAVPAASVKVTNVNTNAVRQTVSTPTGDYSFPSLPPGTYTVRVEQPGFKAAEN